MYMVLFEVFGTVALKSYTILKAAILYGKLLTKVIPLRNIDTKTLVWVP